MKSGATTSETIQYGILKSIATVMAAIPRRIMTAVAIPVGLLWFAADRRHRGIALSNLHRVFGNRLSPQGIRRLARANFIQFARLLFEMPYLFKLNRSNLDRYVSFEGLAHVREALSMKKSILILTAHMGNWELMALAFALKTGRSCHVIARPLDYPPADRLLTDLRRTAGNRVVNKANASKLMAGLLRNKEIVGILMDQTASWYEGVLVPFFGDLAYTNKGVAMFARRYGAVVLPAFNHRLPDGRYHIVVDKPMAIIRTGNTKTDIMVNTERFNQVIEKHILRSPDNWFWVHRRWRVITVPDNQKKRVEEDLTYHGTTGLSTS